MRQARHRPDPCPTVPAPGQGENRALGSAPCAPNCSPVSPPRIPQASRRSTAAWPSGSKASTTTRPTAASTARHPLERWAQTAEQVRFPEPTLDLDDLFLFEATRKVQKDRTVSLDGVVYEVDAALVGERVTLRYDPAAAAGTSRAGLARRQPDPSSPNPSICTPTASSSATGPRAPSAPTPPPPSRHPRR